MYIEEVVIDGFKSYASRTVISGFDKKFNAITGLNGSGKSNILDAICFVLGITNLSQVRASSLTELVYKQGQAGITKASVTIVFNNSDTSASPVGYEKDNPLTVTRQVVLGGRTKYLLNGRTAEVNKIQSLFHSVQLNVNNPHFLIMQGRITKVLNMKPPEILGMIEEAAGTKMYEMKKSTALSKLENKESKVKEINQLLEMEITPTLNKLRQEKALYLDFSAKETEFKRLEKFCIAYEYSKFSQQDQNQMGEVNKIQEKMKETEEEIKTLENNEKNIKNKIKKLRKTKEDQFKHAFAESSAREEELSKKLVKTTSIYENLIKSLKKEEHNIQQLNKQCTNDKNLKKKKTLIEQQELQLKDIRKKVEEESINLSELQRQLQALNAGMSLEASNCLSFSEQLSVKQREVMENKTMIKQLTMEIHHLKKSISNDEETLERTKEQQKQFHSQIQNYEKDLEQLRNNLNRFSSNPQEEEEKLNQERDNLQEKIRTLQGDIHRLSAQVNSSLKFDYTNPYNSFDRTKVKGRIALLMEVKHLEAALALEIAGGGKLYQIVVDDDQTGKDLLKRGKLQTRVTLIPLNKIQRKIISSDKIALAKRLIGSEGFIESALALVTYDSQVAAAMEYAFDSILIASTSQVAEKITFHKDIRTKTVTFAGDSFDPAGTLQGGSSASSSYCLLKKLEELKRHKLSVQDMNKQLEHIEKKLKDIHYQSKDHTVLMKEMQLKQHQLNLVNQSLSGTEYAQVAEELERKRIELQKAIQDLQRTKELEKQGQEECEELNHQIQNREASRDSLCSSIETKITKSKQQVQKGKHQLQEQQEKLDVLVLEYQQEEQDQESNKEMILSKEQAILSLKSEIEVTTLLMTKTKEEYQILHEKIEKKKQEMNICNQELQQADEEQENIIKELGNKQIEKKKLEHKLTNLQKNAEQVHNHLKTLLSKHTWIKEEEQYFNKPQTNYDFTNVNPQQNKKRLEQLKEHIEQTSKKLNKKVMGMMEKAEQEYNNLINKRHIIENDKAKIKSVIEELDRKKEQVLEATWTKVTSHFGSIFSTLLPGTQAKLKKLDGQDLLAGLQVSVAFGGVWKASLTELSGGQRSLLALSLILALLRNKPAPMYILDEIDAALDLSHTQNIGQMIKNHFQDSQFIVVSLKEGMFNNANVLFKTKFVDGLSTVTRASTRKKKDT